MSENFEKLLNESFAGSDLSPGALIRATVVYVNKDAVVVNAGLKSDAVIAASEFRNSNGEVSVVTGDKVDVIVEAIEDGFGQTRLSREKARRAEAWKELEGAHQSKKTVIGYISGRVKGGFTVELNGVRAFLPGSLVDVRPVRDPSSIEGKELEFKVIKMDRKRNNIVVSRRAVVEEGSSADREAMLEKLEEGSEIDGIVKNITDYGAFIDLGGVDGLLHITDMAWKRIKHPSEMLTVGDELKVKILKFDREKKRVSLGIKQLGGDPWREVIDKFPVKSKLKGRVTNLTDYGCFVEIADGVEGLVHMSEMDWTNKNIHPGKIVQLGDEVEVMVLEIDEERRRISLGIKQCQGNPWDTYASAHGVGEHIKGAIRSITDFGIFIGLDGGIDGLVHLSDISWEKTGEEAVRDYKKGDELEAIILAVDPDRERISLGIKQLEGDPFMDFIKAHKVGDVVTGSVKEVEAKKAMISLGEHVEGVLKVSEVSIDRVKDVREHLKVGDEVDAKIASIDNNTRTISLSVKELQKEGGANLSGASEAKTNLGDILKDQMEDKDSE